MWTTAGSDLRNGKRATKRFKDKSQKVGDNTLSQIHHNGTLQKGKAIALNSAERKIVKTEEQNSLWRVFQLVYQRLWPNYFFNVWHGIIHDRGWLLIGSNRNKTKTPIQKCSLWVISSLIKLLLPCLTWNFQSIMDWFQHTSQPRWSHTFCVHVRDKESNQKLWSNHHWDWWCQGCVA